MQGIERIENALSMAKETQSAALMPYFTLGYPDREQSLTAIEAIARHSDLLELGVPFSDPIADGPTVQHSTQKSLEAGTTVAGCLGMVRELRQRGMTTPVLLMGYMNPIMAYGVERFIRDAQQAGVEGLIVPDLPPEESAEIEHYCQQYGLAYVFFLAPTSNPRRIRAITQRANSFIYMVSLTGVTGARSQVSKGLDTFIATIREQTDVPIAVGFGISSAEHARAVGAYADGVIVGSALINAYNRGGVGEAVQFVMGLREGLLKRDL